MQRFVLFSTPTPNENFPQIEKALFPQIFDKPRFAFIPANGLDQCKPKYIDFWRKVAKKNNANFFVVDLGIDMHLLSIERQKVSMADIVVISGGDTLLLWKLLTKCKMLSALRRFVKKPDFVLGGYSAGAIIMTPNLRISPFFREAEPQTEALRGGFNFLDFEILPHYDPVKHDEKLKDYKAISEYPVRTISDSDYLVIEKESKNNNKKEQ